MAYPMRFLLIMVICILGACVPNKRLVYLQSKHEPRRGAVNNTDSLSRTYTTHLTNYILKPGDIISVRIASITPGDYDFVKKYEEQLGLIRKLNQYNQGNPTGGNVGGAGGVGGGAVGGAGTGDMISLSLDRLQSGFILDDEGNLELPYINKLKLAGLTIPQTELLVRQKLVGYFETPVVRVQILSFHFTILGEVTKEGRYTIFDPSANIVDAIAMASNLTELADRSKIKIVRMDGVQAKVFYVNMLREDILGQPGYYLQPNDLIIVPPLPVRPVNKYLPNYSIFISLAASTLALTLYIISLKK